MSDSAIVEIEKRVSVTRRYVKEFGNLKMAVVERQLPDRTLKTSTEIFNGDATPDLWHRLEEVLDKADRWIEAQ